LLNDLHDSRSRALRDLCGPIAAAVVCDEDLATNSRAVEERLGFPYAGLDRLRLI
jgi:hypothetical protein